MEKYFISMKEANMRFKNADHMVYVTFPLINDPKILIVIAENLYYALLNAIDALLNFEYYHKRLDYLPENLNDKLRTFREVVAKTYRFSRDIAVIFEDLHKLIEFRQKSPIEFIRKSNYILADNVYSTRMISFQKIKEYVVTVKPFMQKVDKVIG